MAHLFRYVKGSYLSLRSLGPSVTILEALRRLLKVRYRVGGLVVNDDEVFRTLRKLFLKGYRVYADSNYLYINTGWGVLRAPLRDRDAYNWLMLALTEDIEGFYECLDVEGKVVLDIGAFMGETPCLFAKRGARKVYAFEPVKKFYDILVDNVRLNKLCGKVSAYNYGAWVSDDELTINITGEDSGLRLCSDRIECGRPERIRTKSLASIIEFVSNESGGSDDLVAKLDCEGCEYALLTTDCSVIRKVREYVVEIHGVHMPLLHKMLKCGYEARLFKRLTDDKVPLTIWHFKRLTA